MWDSDSGPSDDDVLAMAAFQTDRPDANPYQSAAATGPRNVPSCSRRRQAFALILGSLFFLLGYFAIDLPSPGRLGPGPWLLAAYLLSTTGFSLATQSPPLRFLVAAFVGAMLIFLAFMTLNLDSFEGRLVVWLVPQMWQLPSPLLALAGAAGSVVPVGLCMGVESRLTTNQVKGTLGRTLRGGQFGAASTALLVLVLIPLLYFLLLPSENFRRFPNRVQKTPPPVGQIALMATVGILSGAAAGAMTGAVTKDAPECVSR